MRLLVDTYIAPNGVGLTLKNSQHSSSQCVKERRLRQFADDQSADRSAHSKDPRGQPFAPRRSRLRKLRIPRELSGNRIRPSVSACLTAPNRLSTSVAPV
jgi:hypothetical protein